MGCAVQDHASAGLAVVRQLIDRWENQFAAFCDTSVVLWPSCYAAHRTKASCLTSMRVDPLPTQVSCILSLLSEFRHDAHRA